MPPPAKRSASSKAAAAKRKAAKEQASVATDAPKPPPRKPPPPPDEPQRVAVTIDPVRVALDVSNLVAVAMNAAAGDFADAMDILIRIDEGEMASPTGNVTASKLAKLSVIEASHIAAASARAAAEKEEEPG